MPIKISACPINSIRRLTYGRREVKYFMNGSDIFLSLYDHSNLCNPILEALVCGKCIVTIDDGSTRGILRDGYNAVLVKKEDLEKRLPKIIVSLLSDEKRRNQIRENARKYAETHLYTWDERMMMEIKEVEKIMKREENKWK